MIDTELLIHSVRCSGLSGMGHNFAQDICLVCAVQNALKDICTAVLLSIELSGLAALLAQNCMVGPLSSQDHAQKLRCGMIFKGLAC